MERQAYLTSALPSREAPMATEAACPKSPTGEHDWYVLRPTGSGAKDNCRWCGKLKHLTDPVLVAELRNIARAALAGGSDD